MVKILTILSIIICSVTYGQRPLPILLSGHIKLEAGVYVLPVNFSMDYRDTDITIEGVAGKTVITSYDGTEATNFNPKEIDTNLPDTFSNGLYVVSNHPYISYGGGFAHLKLTYNTGGNIVFYTMGTILKKENGIWSRHYTGYGFKSRGNMTFKDVIFENCQFYLFSPFGQTISDRFQLINCSFKNVSRVLSSITYAGIDHKPDWYNALNYYNVFGNLRFKSFEIKDCTFEKIHTSIVWGVPPSESIEITGNKIKDCNTMIAAFNLFIKFYGNESYFSDKVSQVITSNTFMNVRSSQNWQTALIRTSGIANVSNNNFIDCTQQIVFGYGENLIFSENIVKKINTPTEFPSEVVLIKSPTGSNKFIGNEVYAPYSTFVSLEGGSSCTFTGNTVTGKTFYSRVDANSSTGYVKINGNIIKCATITNLSSRNPSSFRTVDVSGNTMISPVYQHTGIATIANYFYNNNSITP